MNQDGRVHAGEVGGSLLVLAAALLWGTTGVTATFAPEVSPLAIGAGTMGVGGLLLALVAGRYLRAAWPALLHAWPTLLAGGIAIAIYPLAFYASMRLAGVTVGTVIAIGSAPLFSALIERCFDRLHMTRRWLLGAALGLLGVALLGGARHHAPGAATTGLDEFSGVLLALLAGLTYAWFSWIGHRLMQRGVPSRAALGSIFGVGGILLLPILARYGAPFLASAGNFAVGAYLALVPMLAAYLLFGYGLARIRTSKATAISLAEPVVATLLAAIIVGERIAPLGWLGIGLVFASLFFTAFAVPRRRLGTGADST